MAPHTATAFEGVRGFFSPVTYPAALAWRVGAWLRVRSQYEAHAHCPVISVGNLQVGGTGKTPMVMWVCNELSHLGRSPLVVSRGYGRQSNHTLLVAHDHSVKDVGDEPLMMARAGWNVVVSHDRARAIECARQKIDFDCVVLDDGFLQRQLAVDCQIVMWDAQRGGSDQCLPYGNLRAGLSTLALADAICVQSDAQAPSATLNLRGRYAGPELPLANVGYHDAQLTNINGRRLDSLPQCAFVAAGVGNPARVHAQLLRMGIKTVESIAIEDHDLWTEKTFQKIQTRVAQSGTTDECLLVITRKDQIKHGDWSQHQWDHAAGIKTAVVAAEFGPDEVSKAMLIREIEALWQT